MNAALESQPAIDLLRLVRCAGARIGLRAGRRIRIEGRLPADCLKLVREQPKRLIAQARAEQIRLVAWLDEQIDRWAKRDPWLRSDRVLQESIDQALTDIESGQDARIVWSRVMHLTQMRIAENPARPQSTRTIGAT
ncbi:unnamed protein product [Tuwongella immobilis]|uniref:Uncharacterized protein n=1 Tax=Tuwongella immobilis TaxID=692036 RepID=A0A6C2YRM4_9BACT|nr:unnamed protein product [Tuwongella immobilis]VTS04914.1 unnamed protein product [Tuwongella immobilis]